MKAEINKSNPMPLTLIMLLLTLSKVYFMYYNTLTPESSFLAFFRTVLALAVFYFLINLLTFKRSFIMKLAMHELLAFIVLADILYFKYFNILPSGNDLKLIGTLPYLGDSISELFNPWYLLLFADSILLSLYHYIWAYKFKRVFIGFEPKAITAAVLILIMISDIAVFGSSQSYQNFNSFGLFHFHGSQIKDMLLSRKAIDVNSLSITSLESTTQESSEKPKHFGIARDRNLIVIQVEALQNFTINRIYNGQEVTPNLNKLLQKDSIYYDSYHHHVAKGGTSDAEFTTLSSLYPASDIPSFTKYESKRIIGLPRVLKNEGYSAIAFHGFNPEFWNRDKMYSNLGFDNFVNGSTLKKDEEIGWGISDKSFFRQVAAYLGKEKQPFFAFAITLTNHYPYNLPVEYQSLKLPNEKTTFIERYMQSTNYTDTAIGEFIEELKKNSLYENSIIAIYGDHHAISNRDPRLKEGMTKLLGYTYDDEEMANVPLIIHIPNSGINEVNSTVGGQLDFMPTLLNLLGIENSETKYYGQDLNNTRSGFATTQHVLTKGSFISDDKVFLMSKDGIFENSTAWDRKTKQPIDLELCRQGYEKVMRETEECDYLLNKDILYK